MCTNRLNFDKINNLKSVYNLINPLTLENEIVMVKSFRGRSVSSSVRTSQDDSAPELDPLTDTYAKVIESRGKGQFLVVLLTSKREILVYMPPKFRNALWIRRGSYVIIRLFQQKLDIESSTASTSSSASSSTSATAELVHVLSNDQIKEIKRDGGWPADFAIEDAFEKQKPDAVDLDELLAMSEDEDEE